MAPCCARTYEHSCSRDSRRLGRRFAASASAHHQQRARSSARAGERPVGRLEGGTRDLAPFARSTDSAAVHINSVACTKPIQRATPNRRPHSPAQSLLIRQTHPVPFAKRACSCFDTLKCASDARRLSTARPTTPAQVLGSRRVSGLSSARLTSASALTHSMYIYKCGDAAAPRRTRSQGSGTCCAPKLNL